MGWETVAWVESDRYCQGQLKKHFPKAKGYGDIREFKGTKYTGRIDVVTGGFPCQDLSVANSNGRKGLTGEKSGLYRELIRCGREIKPTHALIENVYGLVTQDNGQAIETMFADLAIEGYQTIPLVLYASAFGANHHRKRFFAYATRERNGVPAWEVQARRNITFDLPRWDSEPGVCRVYDGIPEKLDKRRLRALGNAVSPYIVYDIFKAIEQSQ